MKNHILIAGIATLMLASCAQRSQAGLTLSGLNPAKLQTVMNNTQTGLYTLKNKADMEVCITNFGGYIASITVLDKNGETKNVALGFGSIADYINVPNDSGTSIGCCASRINQDKMVLDGDMVQLSKNNSGHCLHGGPKGQQYRMYGASPVDETTLELTRSPPDGNANFPGNLTAKVLFKLADDSAIDIRYSATTDRKTVINMTDHSYFSLSGNPSKAATNHMLYVNADNYTPVDRIYITTREIVLVKDTPMDSTTPKVVSRDITDSDSIQLKYGNGYDRNWVLNTSGDVKQLAAKLTSPENGISLEVYTGGPGIQICTGNFLDGTVKGEKGIVYNQRVSVCLETQYYPDSPNKP